jgi:hypothetical protein
MTMDHFDAMTGMKKIGQNGALDSFADIILR